MDDEHRGNDAWKEMLILSGHEEPHTLKIINQENRETVLVNTLAYFMHPKLSHGLKDCIIQNLLKKSNRTREESGEFLCLTTEFPCPDSKDKKSIKRIDLVIEFENLCIAIEAKVDSVVQNDLDAYMEHLKERAGGRVTKQYLLQKKSTKPHKSPPWGNITWSDLVGDCTLEDTSSERKNHLQSLFQGLKNVDKTPDEIELGELTPTVEILDKNAKLLIDRLEKKFPKSLKIWKGDKKIGREIFEPRVVLEVDKIVIDVCVGFRGIQFVIWNWKYQPKLHRKMREKYPFIYWQDYCDTIELFDRYLLCKNGKEGPQVSDSFPNAMDEKTIFFKETYFGEEQNWIDESVTKIEELLKNLK